MARNIVWSWGVPRTTQGYWDMGSITIPPLPQRIVLTDTNTGTLSEIVHDGNNPGALSVVTGGTISPKPDKLIYPVNEGPIVGQAYIGPNLIVFRLQVASGVLSYQAVAAPQGVSDQDTATTYIRTTLSGKVILITLPTISETGVITLSPLNFSVVTVP